MTRPGLRQGVNRAMTALRRIGGPPPWFTALVLRVAAAIPFWRSGLTKWEAPGQLEAGTLWLFRHEFQLHLLGQTYPMPLPVLTAHLAAIAEILLPVLLVLGLGTRAAALGLLLMTGVIQLTLPGAWASHHLPWAAMLLAILTWGPGRLSLDHGLRQGLQSLRRKPPGG
ncbi:DoxX family protein [Ectothiorhodospira mobilis]|uniref:DoxX family protein n=1 Tax=Ectothiorhodospira mobilis TaxID=195064 RepID=UPI002379A931|nr:DoxX family protein [Ectothiorhodospira mobilis]